MHSSKDCLDCCYRQEWRFASWLAIQVIDSGIGIAVTDQERVFEEFEQVEQDRVLTRLIVAQDLVLLFRRRLARLLGGDLLCRERAGKGLDVYSLASGQRSRIRAGVEFRAFVQRFPRLLSEPVALPSCVPGSILLPGMPVVNAITSGYRFPGSLESAFMTTCSSAGENFSLSLAALSGIGGSVRS